ncbi:MAG: hypothetical protein OQL06_02250 [Gammaproteobacteria bacterium]|nr:hypothetical protein [Gammaproteobacteria bacterium]
MIKLISPVILLCVSFLCFASSTEFSLATGDDNLDHALNALNKIVTSEKTDNFILQLEKEYRLPQVKIKKLFDAYNFTAAEVFMTIAISDLTGQPLNIITRAYIEHKTKGWVYVLDQLNLHPRSIEFKQIKSDIDSILNRSI